MAKLKINLTDFIANDIAKYSGQYLKRENDYKFAIIMPVYNGSEFLDQSVLSVINQIHQNWTLFVVDDCSTDESFDVVKFHQSQDSRIIALQNSENIGCGASRNTAIRIANSLGCYDYYSFLDCDDCWNPDHLMTVNTAFLDNSDIDIVYTDCEFKTWPDKQPAEHLRPAHTPENFDFDTLFWKGNFILVSTSTIRQTVVDSVGLFDSRLRALEDYDYWIRSHLNGHKFKRIPVKDTIYYRAQTSLSDKILEVMPLLKQKYGFE